MRLILFFLILTTACTSKLKEQPGNNMENRKKFITAIYENFNKRNIDFVIDNMTPEVKWANGMDGGFVYGHEGVRAYWTRQFKLVSSNVTPLEVTGSNGDVVVKVHQVVHDLDGNLLADEIVTHAFKMEGDKIAQFEIAK